ncbi:hypothetical protein V501_02264 [Pseudogymnoascus sp. VKM F-4519 (FW-2642)]|nr:hypothetical protein V501_02264 [Pseudogymnoascus sp. VKM F-4519 (FW-2642)]
MGADIRWSPTRPASEDQQGEHQGVQSISRKADEKKIRQLMMALDRALDRCEDTMRRTGHPILCWLNSGSRNRFYQKPFSYLGRAATRQRYRRLFQRIIPFLFRALNMTAAVRNSALGIRFTTKQSKELRRVWNDIAWAEEDKDIGNADDKDQACLNSGNIWEAGEDDNSGDEYNEGDEDEYNSEEDEEKDDTSDESEIEGGEEGCMTHPENKDEDKKKDSEVSYGREEQYTFTPKVDKLAEIIFRLSVFLATEQFTNEQPSSSLLVYYSGVLGCTEDGSTFRRPKDYTPQLSALIYIQRLLLLEFALPYRAYTYVCIPCRPQYDQLERLDQVRLKSMVLGCLTPLGEFISLRSRGRKLARADPPSFLARWSDDGQTLHHNNSSISMDNFRTFGHSVVDRAEALCYSLMFNWFPGVDLSQVKDDMTNTIQGYSFLQHPANDLSTAYLTLSTRACTAQGDGLLRGDSTNNEFTVVRFLPARPGKLLYYYLVYIRLFAAMIKREISKSNKTVSGSLLFCCLNEPRRLLHSKRLTDVLVKSSARFFKQPFDIRLYRQVSICITEKHVKRLAKPFNRYDDQSADADPNVVFAWQSGHRPLQRGLTYGLDGAFPSQMQPALLNIYEWASMEWHQYLGHKSRDNDLVKGRQLLPLPACKYVSRGLDSIGISNPKELLGQVDLEIRRSSGRKPKLANSSHTIECRFLPPVPP